jgi:hypothetical protein
VESMCALQSTTFPWLFRFRNERELGWSFCPDRKLLGLRVRVPEPLKSRPFRGHESMPQETSGEPDAPFLASTCPAQLRHCWFGFPPPGLGPQPAAPVG